MAKLSKEEIKVLLRMEIDNAIGYLETETVEARAAALNAYLRNPYGNEIEGKSQIVTGEVAEGFRRYALSAAALASTVSVSR